MKNYEQRVGKPAPPKAPKAITSAARLALQKQWANDDGIRREAIDTQKTLRATEKGDDWSAADEKALQRQLELAVADEKEAEEALAKNKEQQAAQQIIDEQQQEKAREKPAEPLIPGRPVAPQDPPADGITQTTSSSAGDAAPSRTGVDDGPSSGAHTTVPLQGGIPLPPGPTGAPERGVAADIPLPRKPGGRAGGAGGAPSSTELSRDACSGRRRGRSDRES